MLAHATDNVLQDVHCKIVWFHFTCLKPTNKPKSKKRYCPECRKLPEFSKKEGKIYVDSLMWVLNNVLAAVCNVYLMVVNTCVLVGKLYIDGYAMENDMV